MSLYRLNLCRMRTKFKQINNIRFSQIYKGFQSFEKLRIMTENMVNFRMEKERQPDLLNAGMHQILPSIKLFNNYGYASAVAFLSSAIQLPLNSIVDKAEIFLRSIPVYRRFWPFKLVIFRYRCAEWKRQSYATSKNSGHSFTGATNWEGDCIQCCTGVNLTFSLYKEFFLLYIHTYAFSKIPYFLYLDHPL